MRKRPSRLHRDPGAGSRSVSETLDRLLLEARAGHVAGFRARSVKGTVRIDPSDPDLLRADDAVRRLIVSSLARHRKPVRHAKG